MESESAESTESAESAGSTLDLSAVFRLAGISEMGVLWQCISAITRLEVPERLADGGMNVAELARAVGAVEQPLFRVLRFLAGHEIVAFKGGDVVLTKVGRLLVRDEPWSMWAVFAATGQQDVAHVLPETLRTGRPAVEIVFGATLWEHLATRPTAREAFDDLMHRQAHGLVSTCIPSLEWPAEGTVADIGGGRGILLAAALNTAPGLRGILVDRPEVFEDAKEFLSQQQVMGRCELYPGDLFDPAPRADIYLLSFILHDWADDNARRILHSIYRNAPRNATLRIFERIVPDDDSAHVSKMFDMGMLLLGDGRERTLGELRDLLAECGWKIESTIPAYADISLIQAAHISGDGAGK
jgi:hypothetical protein